MSYQSLVYQPPVDIENQAEIYFCHPDQVGEACQICGALLRKCAVFFIGSVLLPEESLYHLWVEMPARFP